MHLDEEGVQRLIDGELAPDPERVARAHLAACAECREAVARAEREAAEVRTLLGQLDEPVPAPAPILSFPAMPTPRPTRPELGRSPRPLQLAAGLLLLLGLAGAAAALPGSPVRSWMAALRERLSGGNPSSPTALPVSVPAPDTAASGIAVPADEPLLIVFARAQAAGAARITLTDGIRVVVRAPQGAASFSSGAGRLTIDNRAAAAGYEIEIPRSAPRVEVRVGDRQLFLKEGAEPPMTTAAGADGIYRLLLSAR